MQERIAPYPVRLSTELKSVLKKIADKNDRSLHREIIRRLEESIRKETA